MQWKCTPLQCVEIQVPSGCHSVSVTNTLGQWFKVTRTACISISTAMDAQGMAVLPNSMLPPPVGRWTQQDWLMGRGLG